MSRVNVFVNLLAGLGLGETLPERLKRLRKAARLTQAQLAEAVGVAVGTVNKWEQGKQGLAGRNLTKVAKALGVTMEALSGPTENVSRETSINGNGDLEALIQELATASPSERRRLLYLLRALRAADTGDVEPPGQ